MDEPKIEIPPWLPWATTACLAALAACFIELWMVERARNQLLRDESQLSATAMMGIGNQLEAERIISRREIATLRPAPGSQGALRVALLAPAPQGSPAAMGALAWDPAEGSGVLRFSGLPPQAPGRDYELWLDGAGPHRPARCALFHADAGNGEAAVRMPPGDAAAPEDRFLLIDGARGGSQSLAEAQARGSIVLATPLAAGRISN
jgi:Anti-sigma-K factor rskA